MSFDHVKKLESVLLKCSKWLNENGRLIMSTEHPLRTAPTKERWSDQTEGRYGLIYDYGKEGWRNYFWFGNTEPVKVFHHKLESWIIFLKKTGLDLISIKEPVSNQSKDANNPRFWMLVAEKKGIRKNIITVDGKTASGKTTIANKLAQELEMPHIDSGLIMRFFFYMSKHGIEDYDFTFNDQHLEFYVNGEVIENNVLSDALAVELSETGSTHSIREKANTFLSSIINKYEKGGCIVSGRAMGKTIRNPIVRFYLTCPLEIRKQRSNYNGKNIENRDNFDSKRYSESSIDIDTISIDTSVNGVTDTVSSMKDIVAILN